MPVRAISSSELKPLRFRLRLPVRSEVQSCGLKAYSATVAYCAKPSQAKPSQAKAAVRAVVRSVNR